MKKVMFAAAAIAAGVAMADVTSANIVGYQTKDLASATYTMLTVPFNHVTADGKGLMLNSDITVDGIKGDMDNWMLADQIWVWVPAREAYDKFYFYDDGDEHGWSIVTGEQPYFEDIEEYKNGLPEGSAIYFLAKEGVKSLTGSGAVEQKDEVEVPLASGTYTMFANPYPTALQLNDADQFGVDGIKGDMDNWMLADQIWVWVPAREAYDKFYFYDDGDEHGWSIVTGEQPYIEDIAEYKNGLPSGTGLYFLAKEGKKSVIAKKNF